MAVININTKEKSESLRETNLPILVEYMAPWCVYCRRIGPAYDQLAQQYDGKVIFAKIDIDEEPQLAEQEQIEVVPTLIIYHKGKALGSIVAPESKAKIDAFIKETWKELEGAE